MYKEKMNMIKKIDFDEDGEREAIKLSYKR